MLFSGTSSRADDTPATTEATPSAPTETKAGVPATATKPQPPKPAAEEVIPYNLIPYRMSIEIGITRDATFNDQTIARLLERLQRGLDSRVGPLWDFKLQLAERLQPGTLETLTSMPEESLTAIANAGEFDQSFAMSIERIGAGYRVGCRSWDRNSQTSTAVSSREFYEGRELEEAILSQLLTHFRPLAEITEVSEDGTNVSLFLRGGELLPPDSELAPALVGQLLTPYYRYLDRKKELRQIQHTPWTFLRITSVNRSFAQAEVISAFRSAIAGKRRRVELMAITLKPKFPQTQVMIYPRKQHNNPLAGVRVDVMNRKPTLEDAVEDRVSKLTDRFGTVHIDTDPEHPLQYIYVMSGQAVLAIVPFIPGNQKYVEVEVPDDTPRLNVEGQVELLEAELIETVARREVLIARARNMSKEDDKWEEVDKLVKELKELPDIKSFNKRLYDLKQTGLAQALDNNDRVAGVRINRLAAGLQEHIDKHMIVTKLADFFKEMQELRPKGA